MENSFPAFKKGSKLGEKYTFEKWLYKSDGTCNLQFIVEGSAKKQKSSISFKLWKLASDKFNKTNSGINKTWLINNDFGGGSNIVEVINWLLIRKYRN